ncbi:PITH domain-containing protein [Trichoderma austrokoningii]
MADAVEDIASKAQFDELLQRSPIVIAKFYSDADESCKAIEPLYQALAEQIGRPRLLIFAQVDNDACQDLEQEYKITVLPTFLLFRKGKLVHTVQGANTAELRDVTGKIVSELELLVEGMGGEGSSAEAWKGAEIPKGYSNVTDQVELRGCELLNADDNAGPVKVLFESSKPSALGLGKNTSPDWVQSGSDDQLLLFIPFQSTIKLHTLQITSVIPEGSTEVSRPVEIRLFLNRTSNMDFGEAEDAEPQQSITLEPAHWNSASTASIGLRFVKFQKTNTLTLFVQQGDGEADAVRIDRIKLIGEAGAKRDMGKLQKLDDDE